MHVSEQILQVQTCILIILWIFLRSVIFLWFLNCWITWTLALSKYKDIAQDITRAFLFPRRPLFLHINCCCFCLGRVKLCLAHNQMSCQRRRKRVTLGFPTKKERKSSGGKKQQKLIPIFLSPFLVKPKTKTFWRKKQRPTTTKLLNVCSPGWLGWEKRKDPQRFSEQKSLTRFFSFGGSHRMCI